MICHRFAHNFARKAPRDQPPDRLSPDRSTRRPEKHTTARLLASRRAAFRPARLAC